MQQREERRFLIVGCQRSGTTLLRLILESHGQVKCYDEFRAYQVLCGGTPISESKPVIGFKVPNLTEHLAQPMVRFESRLVPNTYRGENLVFMVREVQAVVSSMIKLQVGGKPWIETVGLPWLIYRLETDKVFTSHYSDLMLRLLHAPHRRLGIAALYWRTKVEAYFEYLERGFPQLLIRYEDLVRHPRLELLRICGFLRLAWSETLLQHNTIKHTELRPDGKAIGNTDPARPIDTNSLSDWRGHFNEREIEEIFEFAGDTPKALYPEEPSI